MPPAKMEATPAAAVSFEHIHETYRPRIHRYLTRLVGPDGAEDLTQEVFVKVSRALAGFRGESTLATWLYRIATNTARDRLRVRSGQRHAPAGPPPGSEDPDAPASDDGSGPKGETAPSAERQLIRREMNACLRSRIAHLPETYRTVLVLSDLEGLRNKEIAGILGVSLETVKVRLHRARVRLREHLLATCDSSWIWENEFVPDLRHTRPAAPRRVDLPASR